MKKLILIILGIVMLVTAGLLLNNTQYQIQDDLDLSESTSTIGVLGIPKPLTLASLEAREDWNPTMEIEGMVRVEDGVAELSDKEKKIKKHNIHFSQLNDSFVTVLHYDDDFESEFCAKEMMSDLPNVPLKCPRYKPSEYNEFIILSKDTGEVLHKYRLREGYSMTTTAAVLLGSTISPGFGSDENLYFHIGRIDMVEREETITSSFSYTLNVVTGEITLGYDSKSVR
ncbi:MAG: hypothetical protein H6779_02005 [Candidatus Nomurabacteria bacterium]|nr:hypothetical protein [Candidatus Nomurabacteria bacterium]USN88198.1 MAG: hypothetical protein H6779_02005 [Candidatus Nomurabacteria bacterium]